MKPLAIFWSTVALGDAVREIRIRRGHGLAGWVAATGRGVNVKDAYADPRFDARWDEELGFRTRSMLCQPVFDRDGNLTKVMVGTGAFQWDEASSQKGTRVVFKKNPTYWDPSKPYLDGIRLLVIPDFSTRAAALRTGQAVMARVFPKKAHAFKRSETSTNSIQRSACY